MSIGIHLEFHSGVVRFDAMGNLFVHLTHGPGDPHDVVIDGGERQKAPARDRRARIHGTADGTVQGTWPGVTDLPRGLVVEVKGYASCTLRDDGAMEVVVDDAAELPDWLRAGSHHLFARSGELVRMWTKSSVPAGAALDPDATPKRPQKSSAVPAKAAAKKPAAKKPAAKKPAAKKPAAKKPAAKKPAAKKPAAKKPAAKKPAAKKPKPVEPEVAPEPEAAPAPEPEAAPEPTSYRPPPSPPAYQATGRRPEEKTGLLGCSTMIMLSMVLVAALAIF